LPEPTTHSESISPALVLFNEKGELLFVNPEASQVTGFSALELRRLSDCLARLFPKDDELAVISAIVQRALLRTEESEPVHFVAEFATRAGNKRRGTFQIEVWKEGFTGRRLMLCLVPCPALMPSPDHFRQEDPTGVVEQIEELLDDAINGVLTIQREGCSKERLDALVRKIARSRCLLGGTGGLNRVWGNRAPKAEKPVVPLRIKVPETRVES